MICLAQFSRPVRWATRMLWVIGGVGLAIFSAGAIGGYGSPPPDAVQALHTCLYLVPATLCLLRAVVVREERVAWTVFAIGMLS